MRSCVPVVLCLTLAGCGYIGDPLPPALNIPEPVTDLRAVQRGNTIQVDFTLPALTTEQLVIKEFGDVDLRIGSASPPFHIDQWASGAVRVPVPQNAPGAVHVETDAKPWAGKDTVVAVRLQHERGRMSAWSNPVSLRVLSALGTPVGLRAESDPDGVRLSWQPVSDAPSVQYRIFRTSEQRKEPGLVGTAEKPEYVDRSATGTVRYTYFIQAVLGGTESNPSESASLVPVDKFAPAVPAGITIIAGLNSIELAWERNTEPDLRGYRVFRAEAGGDFSPIAELVEAPSYSDKSVTSGKLYRYSVSSIDLAGNESARSPAAEMTAP